MTMIFAELRMKMKIREIKEYVKIPKYLLGCALLALTIFAPAGYDFRDKEKTR
jgi:hypothetical protein